ncbi:Rpn family recombination-promoting nuclease/putative transposase [Salinibius halmophilus]|uniref:Rpn family recombination-promoting nuclease/putative transposase n=1 Tax=Salinibius halmophilus TaxID=1853216 RepID=UPI000E65F6EB|nr:Rpn family recombination-promoting nuclease/putative transposase [Salinibius halmophilus]
MAKINNPHDKFFKQSMQQPILAKQFMQQYLPTKIASALDLESLVYQDGSYINNQMRSVCLIVDFR